MSKTIYLKYWILVASQLQNCDGYYKISKINVKITKHNFSCEQITKADIAWNEIFRSFTASFSASLAYAGVIEIENKTFNHELLHILKIIWFGFNYPPWLGISGHLEQYFLSVMQRCLSCPLIDKLNGVVALLKN